MDDVAARGVRTVPEHIIPIEQASGSGVSGAASGADVTAEWWVSS